MHLLDLFQIAGALLILGAFAAAQLRRLDVHSVPYLVLNVIGAGVLTVLAAIGRDWGFLLLEGVWTVVSAIGLAGALRSGGGARLGPAAVGDQRDRAGHQPER